MRSCQRNQEIIIINVKTCLSSIKSEKCRLCGSDGKLTDSHIIPDLFIRSLEAKLPTGKSGITQPTSILLSLRSDEVGGLRQRGSWEKKYGLKEHLLCRQCENRFSRYERCFRQLFYGNKKGPIRKIEIGTPFNMEAVFGLPAEIIGVRKLQVNYAKFKLFVLSLLWRSSVAKGKFFSKIDLGPHEAEIAALLNSEDPGPENRYFIVMIDLQFVGYGAEDMIRQPDAFRDEAQRAYSFVLGGFMLVIYVGAEGHLPPVPIRPFCLRGNGDLILVSTKAEPILKKWVVGLKQQGKLTQIIRESS